MAGGHEPLLTSSDSKSSQAKAFPTRHWRRTAAALMVMGAIFISACSTVGRSKLKVLRGKLDTSLWGESLKYNDPRCMQNTGGTCNIWGCHADRGPTTCVWWHMGRKCMCQEGYCASEVGRCRNMPTSTQIMNHTFVLRNVQWPDYHLQIWTGSYAVGVSNGEIDEWSKFRLFQLPVARGMRPTMFMLGSAKYPDYLVQTSSNRDCTDHCNEYDTDSQGNRHCVDHTQECHMEYSTMAAWIFKPVREQRHKIYQANWEEPAMMIEGAATPNRYWYIPQFSYTLDVSQLGDPGPQGYWTADPPFPDGLLLPPS